MRRLSSSPPSWMIVYFSHRSLTTSPVFANGVPVVLFPLDAHHPDTLYFWISLLGELVQSGYWNSSTLRHEIEVTVVLHQGYPTFKTRKSCCLVPRTSRILVRPVISSTLKKGTAVVLFKRFDNCLKLGKP